MPPLSPQAFSELGQRVAQSVRACLAGSRAVGETLTDPDDLKSHHAIETHANTVVRQALADHRCNLHIEGMETAYDPEAAFSIYIDPVDGSLNWDRGMGDPAVVLALAAGPAARRLDDLALAYVEGLRTGARYTVDASGAYYRDPVDEHIWPISCTGPDELRQATAYLRCGYGGARAQLERSLGLFLAVRDVRAVDNAGMECAEIARGAAHLMVEARGISDGYNLLAYPILRAAGAVLTDLAGEDIGQRSFRPDQRIDYILAANRWLADQAAKTMEACKSSQRRCIAALVNQLGD